MTKSGVIVLVADVAIKVTEGIKDNIYAIRKRTSVLLNSILNCGLISLK